MGGGQDLRVPYEEGRNCASNSTAAHGSHAKHNPLHQPDFIKRVHEGLKEWRVPGLSIAVIDGDDTWTEGFGWAKVPDSWLEKDQQQGRQGRERGEDDEAGGVRATSKTLWYAGSTTKAFTAAVLGMMIHADDESDMGSEDTKGDNDTNGSCSSDTATFTANATADTEKNRPKAPQSYRGPFASKGWRTPISSLIRDDFVLSDEWATQHITIEDALSHRTGMARHDKSLVLTIQNPSTLSRGDDDDLPPAGIRDWTRGLRHLPFSTEARVSFRYCNLMFIAVAHAIESVTGSWLGNVMDEWIWGPLGMHATFLSLRDAEERGGGHLAEGYDWIIGKQKEGKGKGQKFHHIANMSLRGGSGAGGIISSVDDYAKWIRCLLNESTPLSRAVHRSIKEPRMVTEGSNIDWKTGEKRNGFDGPQMYSLGWFCGTYKGHRVFTHSGGMEAYSSQVYFFPDLGLGVVAMGNTASTAAFLGETLAWGLVDDKLGLKEEDRFDWGMKRKDAMKKAMKKPEKALDDLYPRRAKPGLPKALPLEEYTGTYFHPAYQKLVIEKNMTARKVSISGEDDSKQRGELYAAQHDRVWKQDFEFVHVSGEHWLIHIDFLNVKNGTMGQFARAEFKIGSSGNVEAIHVEYMEDGKEGVIVYEKAQ